ncbi:hypothetical protein QTI05_24090 [Variovorax sp. J22R193]|uniref:hypothetical protein n=1 Tax=Variovorax fucosicus TaxID=3053517 RepID=UPI002575A1FD|nr:hypothetical protein [Variovorax sp. J22R193]MDM0042140.1 hypothetical protein [Variovorax sp. J22R193]
MRKMFEFECEQCKAYQESLVKDEGDYPQCPEGHGKMLKLISRSTFHFVNGAGTDMGKAYAFRDRPLWGGTD